MTKPSEYIQKGWCQGVSARNDKGYGCRALDGEAQSWCLVGAVHKTYPEDPTKREEIYQRIQKAVKLDYTFQVVNWNDNYDRTQAEVVALLQSIGE